MMLWQVTHRADPRVATLADRHYSRKTPGHPQYAPPGRCLVLRTAQADAAWVTSWPYPQYVKHQWPGAWLCSLFRNESAHLSSVLIAQAVAATRWKWGDAPEAGMLTFVDPRSIKSPNPGYCFKRAGWSRCGITKNGLIVLRLLPDAMPEPAPALGGYS